MSRRKSELGEQFGTLRQVLALPAQAGSEGRMRHHRGETVVCRGCCVRVPVESVKDRDAAKPVCRRCECRDEA